MLLITFVFNSKQLPRIFSMAIRLFILVFFFLSGLGLVAPATARCAPFPPWGTDSTIVKKDSAENTSPESRKPFQPNPKRAGLFSAILPGLGQVYNRQYWKVPVIYAGFAVAGYFINDNLTNYRSYRKAYIGRINNPFPTDEYVDIYSREQLAQLQNEYSKYLNLSVLFTGVGYTLQVIEALTGAHLKNFDVSRDISLHIQPDLRPGAAGVSLALSFR